MSKKDLAKNVSFFGKMLTFSRIRLSTNDLEEIKEQLSGFTPNKDSQIPVIIESSISQDLEALTDLLWDWGFQPIGVIKGVLDEQAKHNRLAIFPADGKRIPSITPAANQTTANRLQATIDPINKTDKLTAITKLDQDIYDKDVTAVTGLVYEQMLRSGQSMNHVGGDLVITQGINDGAEAITDNNLHVYGHGQGRLVAGATGDQNAHIFCQHFNPSLVSVAGTYCLRDSIPAEVIDQPVHVSYVSGEGLVFQIMDN